MVHRQEQDIPQQMRSKNISTVVHHQLPEFVRNDHPLFSTFLQHYYKFLEAGELTLSGSNNYLIEETNSINYILAENDTNVVLESSTGKFVEGEIIIGATSNRSATILVDDFDDNNRLFISSQQLFDTGEDVVGQTSGAQATITKYRGNPVQNIQELLEYANVDNTIYDFLDKFYSSFMSSLPSTLASGVSKRNLIKSIKDLYSAKGTEDGHKLFFRILFDKTAELIYPRDNMLRVSDGKWSTDKIMRVVEIGTADFNELVGQTVTGRTSGATAIVASIIKFRDNETLIAELSLDEESITGTFTTGEIVTGVSNELDLDISATIQTVISSAAVNNGGLYYAINDTINSSSATTITKVESISSGSINEVIIEDAGTGYAVGDSLDFDNTNTDGTGLRARIAVVGGGVELETKTSPDHMLSEAEDLLITEDRYYINQEQSVGDVDSLTLEDGGQIMLEADTFATSAESTEITKIDIIDGGSGYITLPLVAVSNTSAGSGAVLHSKSTSGVGAVTGITVQNIGFGLVSAPTITFNKNILIKNVTGTFAKGDQLNSHSGTVVNYNSSKELLLLDSDVAFALGDTITTSAGGSADVVQLSLATGTVSIGPIGTTTGSFVSSKGKISENTMRVQDSYYYQDYSYVVKIDESINEWRESLKKSVHPAGWNVFAEISLASQVSAQIDIPAAGSVADNQNDQTFTPELASTFTNLFTTIFGRRLGTSSQGALNASPSVGIDDIDNVDDSKRDLTLSSDVTINIGMTDKDVSFVRAMGAMGPTLNLLPEYAFAVPPLTESLTDINYDLTGDNAGTDWTIFKKGNTASNYPGITRSVRGTYTDGTNTFNNGTVNDSAYFTVEQFGHITVDQVSDASNNIPAAAYTTRINVPPPGEIVISTV